MTRICTACHQAVARKDCHRNRYGDYICRLCQAAGVKFTWRKRVRRSFKRGLKYFLLSLAMGVLVVIVGWAFYVLLDIGAVVLGPRVATRD